MNNLTLFQFFHWYYSTEGNLWLHAADKAKELASMGITHVWLPPAYKSAFGTEEPGYAVYDLYDLGEFDQKGSVRTRYGTRQEYQDCIDRLHKHNIQVLADIVLNHKHGADEKESFPARKVDPYNRTEFVSEEEIIEAWTKFNFPGRKGRYSEFVWDWRTFTGISEDPEHIYLIHNEHTNGQWEDVMEEEFGNYDYLMGADVEFRNPFVREELFNWGKWYMESTKVDGFRLDAVKHIPHDFFNEWLDHLRQHFANDFLCIGEYWSADTGLLLQYIDVTAGKMQLFDVPLHFNFHRASTSGEGFDMSTILHNSLVESKPEMAITFVDNHDTQPLQSLQSPVDYWFKPHAYSIILLRESGLPCIFYPAMYEAKYVDHKDGEEVYVELNTVPGLENLIRVRKELAYGTQRDYFDHPSTVGWTREGIPEKDGSGCAVILTNGAAGVKAMEMGKQNMGKTFVDIYGQCGEIVINEDGWADFPVRDRSISIWINKEALKFFPALDSNS
ncbi:MAG TPA: alpha-amylase [Chitinophagaceae bacterium]|nr:alpha-amylase [Chitinophagaceae bacterium]